MSAGRTVDVRMSLVLQSCFTDVAEKARSIVEAIVDDRPRTHGLFGPNESTTCQDARRACGVRS